MTGRFSPNFVANYLVAWSLESEGREALVQGTHRVTWDGLRHRVFRLASSLQRLGLRPGQTAALVFHNTPEFVEANFAIQVAGGIPVPLNYRYNANELRCQLEHSDARLVLHGAEWRDAVARAAADLSGQHIFIGQGECGAEAMHGYEEIIRAGDPVNQEVPTSSEEVAVITGTGGTTGRPKGVMLSYGAHLEMFSHFLAEVVSRGARMELTTVQLARVADAAPFPGAGLLTRLLLRGQAGRRVLGHGWTHTLLRAAFHHLLSHPELSRFGGDWTSRYLTPSMPFFHSASYQLLILALLTGRLCHLLTSGPAFDAVEVLELIQRERPSFLANVPTGWKRLLDCPVIDRYDLSSVRIAASGAGLCPIALKRSIFAHLPGVVLIDLFGQTEMAPLTAFRIDASPDSLKERSVGRSMFEVRIVDEHGHDVPPGQTGEIWYRGPSMMLGYYHDPQATAQVMVDGWLRSGDLGYLDEQRELCIVDRCIRCINTGGEKVYPLEVEEALQRHPEVDEAWVFGAPDAQWGMAVRALVVLKAGEQCTPEELIAFCREQLSGFKVPKSVRLVTALPRNEVGKVSYGDLGEWNV